MSFDNQFWIRKRYNQQRLIKPVKRSGNAHFNDEDSSEFDKNAHSFQDALEELLDDDDI